MRALPLVLCYLAAVGCGAPKPAVVDGGVPIQSQPKTKVSAPAKVPAPDFTKRTRLRLVRRGEELRVGDSVDDALRVFKEEKNAYKLTDMPPGWQDESYKCSGWETGGQGFGVISTQEKVVLAMYHEEQVDEDRLKEILDTYDDNLQLASTAVTGSSVRYWIWEDDPHRLMICAVQIPSEGLNVTVSLGDSRFMDMLRMSRPAAEKDEETAEALFKEGLKAKQR